MSKHVRAAALALAVLAGGRGVADPAQESFRSPPTHGRLLAREAVAAPHLAAFDPAAATAAATRGVMVRAAWSEPVASPLPDFSAYRDVPTKKARFFAFLLPLVEQENERIAAIRQRLRYIYDHVRWHRELQPDDVRWLVRVGEEYGVDDLTPDETDFWVTLLERVDTLPVDLVLVQAANESAWGTSRFAREGNNLFGQWCFRAGCGIVPAQRPDGATYEVARYDSVTESIGSYMHNLNTGAAYQQLREIRARMRHEGDEPSAGELAAGLSDYSERGLEYVTELRDMIRHNAELISELAGDEIGDQDEAG